MAAVCPAGPDPMMTTLCMTTVVPFVIKPATRATHVRDQRANHRVERGVLQRRLRMRAARRIDWGPAIEDAAAVYVQLGPSRGARSGHFAHSQLKTWSKFAHIFQISPGFRVVCANLGHRCH